MSKKWALALFCGVFLALNVEAAMVSFFIIETGISQEDQRSAHSEQWENAFLDVFFEAGHIVSNSPMLRLEKKPSDEIQKLAKDDIKEAGETGSDYFLVAQLDYLSGSKTPGDISIVLFKITPYGKVTEKRITGKTYKSAKDEIDDLKLIARGFLPLIKN